MIAVILQRETAAPGALVVHGTTHRPLLITDTPMSQFLLARYQKGIRYPALDFTHKRQEIAVPPTSLDKFMKLGPEYFSHMNGILSKRQIEDVKQIEIDGIFYKLEAV